MIEAIRELKPRDKESPFLERRKQVHELSVAIAKLGLLKSGFIKEDFAKWAMTVGPLANWDLGVFTKLISHFQVFGGALIELGTDRHQKWIDLCDNGDIIGAFAAYGLMKEFKSVFPSFLSCIDLLIMILIISFFYAIDPNLVMDLILNRLRHEQIMMKRHASLF
jgi:hypothetical protein